MSDKRLEKSSVWKRLLPALAFMMGLMLLVVFFYDTDTKRVAAPLESTAKARYNVAKNVFEDLKKRDNVSRKQWNSLAQEFYAIYAEYEDWPNRPAALFRNAAVLEALARSTDDEDDYALAVNRYVKLANEFRTSRLADDALLLAAIIQSKNLENKDKALQLLAYMHKSFPRGDMYMASLALEKKLRANEAVSKKRPSPKQANKHAELTQVSWATINENTVQITVALNKNTTWRVSDHKGKSQQILLVMDNTIPDKSVHKGARVKNSVLKQLAILHEKSGKTSLRLDFDNLSKYQTKIEKNPFSIVLTATAKLPPKKEQKKRVVVASAAKPKPAPVVAKSTPVAEARPKKVVTKPVVKKPSTKKTSVANSKKSTSATIKKVATAPKVVQKAVAKEPTAKELSKRVHKANTKNMAVQLGLRMQTVFIDVGHGGRDPGASANGIVERDIVLDMSLRLGKILKAHGLKVVYSRTSNVSVPLSSRPVRANDAGADIFVSMHINANHDKRINGFETYYLNFAKNTEAAQTAALENSTSDRKLGDMQSLLANVMLNVRTTESSNLASDVQRATMLRLKNSGFQTRNGGTRSAPFHVLIGTNMPAILVELGYVSNKKEAGYLKSSKYRNILAQGIARGIVDYKNRVEKGQGLQYALTNSDDDAM